METNQERIWQRIQTLATFNDTPQLGVTRFSYGKNDARARKYLLEECRSMGLDSQIDAVGNILITYPGREKDLPPLWIGSHLDSVRNGGRFDGIVGVVSAWEVLQVLWEQGLTPRRSIQLVVFAEEEGSNFGTTMIGSKSMVGKCDADYLKTLYAEDGRTAWQVMKDFGLDPDQAGKHPLTPQDVYAMMELHIEQGIVLEKMGRTVGVVEAIAGMKTYRIQVTGRSNHAGSTPMDLRQDPMPAAAKLIVEIQRLAQSQALPTTVATVGEVECQPNMTNVIPQQVQFSVDIRDVREEGIQMVLDGIVQKARELEQSDQVQIQMNLVGSSPCVMLDKEMADRIEASVQKRDVPYMRMNSGAVHDSAMLTQVTKVGMIFVPSTEGKSHTATEYTSPEQIKLGADILLDTAWNLVC